MASHIRTSPDPQTALHQLLWAPQNSLATWADDAACIVIDQLPVGIERAGYRHDVSVDAAGVVAHELVDLESSLPVCLMYERRERFSDRGVLPALAGDPTALRRSAPRL
jgi:hypothetical protein